MNKRFKKLLLEIHTRSMSEQEQVLKQTIKEWKKDQEQIDDMLIMGIRI